VVDERNRPVPTGELGAKVLVTVLFSRTQPLIRYEMSDTIALSEASCPCGRKFGLLRAVEGRIEDVLDLPAAHGGQVAIHPNVFHRVLEPLPVRQWQVEQGADVLTVRIVLGQATVEPASIGAALARELTAAGSASVPIRVEIVAAVAKTALGKAPLIKAADRKELEP